MTKQELIKMTGSEEQADFAMEILLRYCKKAFVRMAIQAELNEIEREVKAFEEEGILHNCNSSYHVDWGAPLRFFGDEPGAVWHASEEQKAEPVAVEKRCCEADALLYRRNRTTSLLAVR